MFLISHALPTRPPVRRRLVALMGERVFQLAYSALSLLLLAWLIHAAMTAPYIELWPPARWHMLLVLALMPLAFVLMAIGVGVANPLSISLYRTPGDWRPSGVLRLVRHPLLVGLALWSGLHALSNGTAVSLLMFGGLALFALVGMPMVERRRRLDVGAEALSVLAARRQGASSSGRQAIAAAIGLAVMALLLYVHPALFGADPLAWL